MPSCRLRSEAERASIDPGFNPTEPSLPVKIRPVKWRTLAATAPAETPKIEEAGATAHS